MHDNDCTAGTKAAGAVCLVQQSEWSWYRWGWVIVCTKSSWQLQEEKLRELYGQYSGEKGYLASIAQELMGGFSKGQIGSQLRKLGLRPDKGKKRKSEVGCGCSINCHHAVADMPGQKVALDTCEQLVHHGKICTIVQLFMLWTAHLSLQSRSPA